MTQLRGSTKRFNKMLRSALPASVWPPSLSFVSCAHVGTGYPSAAPWSCCPRRPFSMLCSVLSPPAPHTRPFPRILRGRSSSRERQARAVPASVLGPQPPPYPRTSWSSPLQAGARLRVPVRQGGPPGAGSPASGPAGRLACGAGGLARGPGAGAPVLFAVRRAPGLMAAPGTRGGRRFRAQKKEVVLERPCWLDGGCEQARKGYLYGQLCCVGGSLRLEGRWCRRRTRPRSAGRPRGPGAVPGPGAAPPQARWKHLGRRRGGVPLPPRSLRRRGWGVGQAGRPGFAGSGLRLSAVCLRRCRVGGPGRSCRLCAALCSRLLLPSCLLQASYPGSGPTSRRFLP